MTNYDTLLHEYFLNILLINTLASVHNLLAYVHKVNFIENFLLQKVQQIKELSTNKSLF